MKLVLELDIPDSGTINDAGFVTTKRFRSEVSIRIPWIERSEADSDSAHWEHVEWQLRKSLAFELLGSGKNLLGALTQALCVNLRARKYQREPGFLGKRAAVTEPSPPPSVPPEPFVPPATPTLPSLVNPAVEPDEADSDHVVGPPESV